jgi:hypothetical protein
MVPPPLSFRRPAFFGVAGPLVAVIVALAGDAAAQSAPPPAAPPPSNSSAAAAPKSSAAAAPKSSATAAPTPDALERVVLPPPASAPASAPPIPPAPVAPAAPAYAPAAPMWGPPPGQPAWPAYAPAYPASPSFYQQPEPFSLPPPLPKEAANRKLMITGIVAASVGVATLIAGSIVMSVATGRIDVYRDGPAYCCSIDDAPLRNAGIVMLVAGGITATVGIPLWMIGGRRVLVRGATEKPDTSPQVKAPALRAPLLRVGATGASLSFQF